MARTVFHAGSPQRRRAKLYPTVLNLRCSHTPRGGASASDAMRTTDRRRAASSSRVEGGEPLYALRGLGLRFTVLALSMNGVA